MQVRLIVLPQGKIQIFVDDGTFEEAVNATRAILAELACQSVPMELIGDIEQHRDGVSHVHVLQEARHDH
ncbi:MAG TPA: hypothetical protein VGR88_08260 [Ktedonobacterales bacterium]|nr:hypothetical protein [Ktedonobacterales bacterium]